MAVERSVLSLEDRKHLDWIFNRLINVHGEDPNVDYMLRFKEILRPRYSLLGETSVKGPRFQIWDNVENRALKTDISEEAYGQETVDFLNS